MRTQELLNVIGKKKLGELRPLRFWSPQLRTVAASGRSLYHSTRLSFTRLQQKCSNPKRFYDSRRRYLIRDGRSASAPRRRFRSFS